MPKHLPGHYKATHAVVTLTLDNQSKTENAQMDEWCDVRSKLFNKIINKEWITWKHFNTILNLLNSGIGINPTLTNKNGETLIHLCVRTVIQITQLSEDDRKIRQLVADSKNKHSNILDRYSSKELTLTTEYATKHAINILRDLQENRQYNVDINAKDKHNKTALDYLLPIAIQSKDKLFDDLLTFMDDMAQHGARLSTPFAKDSIQALLKLLNLYQYKRIVSMLEGNVILPDDMINNEGDTPIHAMANIMIKCTSKDTRTYQAHVFAETINDFFKYRDFFDINAKNKEGLTALQLLTNDPDAIDFRSAIKALEKCGATLEDKAVNEKIHLPCHAASP